MMLGILLDRLHTYHVPQYLNHLTPTAPYLTNPFNILALPLLNFLPHLASPLFSPSIRIKAPSHLFVLFPCYLRP